jgi:TP901 family phage tail tape measure protein
MADVNANIGVSIDTSDALNQLKSLQRQISQFHQSVAKSSSAAAIAQRDLQKNFINGVNAIKGFSAELRTVRTSAETFTNSLEKNKFSIQQYFRYAASQTKTFGKNFTSEFATIEKTAIERVKTLQTQYVKMGRDAQGAMQAIAIRPTVLNMKDLGTQTAIAAQKQVIFNQLIKQGSTNLLNFGKNTQWAGRQLMVGFTLPLASLGITAGRVFMDMEKAALKFKKVYGDLFTAPGETNKALDSIMELGLAYTKYGVAVSDSLEVASEAAAAGFQGVALQNQTTAALKLSVLGQIELQQALETTIALQNAFNISSQNLAGEIDFLNAVENQTVVSLDDITEAVPRVAPVIQSLGGDVRDLAFFLAAMKEGGINAAQGANALKSGLASLINPSESATQFIGQLGIDLRGIVARNKGDISGTIVEFAKSLDTLDPQRRAQAIEQLFGKFQFARMSALFDNVVKDGSQAARVLDLAGASASDLADMANKELGVSAASAMNKFKASVEQLKVALAPVGEMFLKIATPFIDFATTVLKAFNSLPDGLKQIIGTVVTVVGGLGPVLLMTFGLINNGIANMIKFFATVRLGYLKMTGQAKGIGDETQYMTQEQLEAAAAAASLDQAHAGLTQRFTAEKTAVDQLRIAYEAAAAAGARFAMLNPGMMKPGSVAAPVKMAKGGVVTVGGRGNKDTEPALLTPGEAVIPAEMVKKYAPLIEGMIAGNIPGYAKGVMLGMPRSAKSVSKNRDASQEIYEMFLKSSYANTAPTEYGHQISPTSGHSFPIFGLGGVYQKGNKQVFVKPVLDEKAALAEMRSTEISRRAHGLEAPEQRIVVIRDPMDTTRTRRFLALESDLDPKFVNNQPMGLFNEEQYFRQLVASLLRVDKDLSGSNVYGNVVADAGPSGVFSRASGLRDYENNLPSMEEQAIVNLLGIKGGAKRAFAESTLGLMAGLTPEQYKAKMLGEIQKVLPRLKETIASFKLTNPTEVGVYDDMIRRLEAGLGVDWSKFHAIHSAVKPAKPKAGTQAAPLELANGIVSVPGPKGAGDVTPAMLTPGEAVIPAEMAKKYAPLINAMIAGNIPGYSRGVKIPAVSNLESMFGQDGSAPTNVSHSKGFSPREFLETARAVTLVSDELRNMRIRVVELTTSVDDSGKKVNTVTERFMTLGEAVERYDPEEHDALVGGKGFGATGILEGKVRNQRAYTAAGISGGATNLEEVVENGRLAGIELERIGDDGSELANELRLLTEEGEEARIALSSVDAVQADYNFVMDHATKALEQAALKDTSYKTIQDARNAAAERTAIIQEAYNKVIQNGGTAEEALVAAKLALKEQIFKASKFVQDEALTIGVGPRGTGGGRLRDVMTTRGIKSEDGGVEYANADPNFIGPANKVKVTGGRDNKTISAMIVRDEAVQSELKAAEQRALGNLEAVGTTVDQAAAKLVNGFLDRIKESLRKATEKGLGVSSPAEEFTNLSNNVKAGVQEAGPEAKKAGEVLGETVVNTAAQQGKIRRASSDPATQADIDRRNQQNTQSTRDSANIVAGTPRGPRRVTREGDKELREQQVAGSMQGLGQTVTRTKTNMDKMMNTASQATMALSSVSGILYMFGGEMQGVAGTVSLVSGGLFALISIVKAYQDLMITEKALARLAAVQEAIRLAVTAAATAGTGVFGTAVSVTGAALYAALGPIGLVVAGLALLAGGFMLFNHIAEETRKRIEGLGNAASLSEEKLKFLADKFNVTAKSINWADRAKAMLATSGKSTEEQKQVVDLMIDPEFEKEFASEISGIKNATKEEAQLALESLATQLRNSGFEDEAVSAIISSIAAKAEQTDLQLNFKPIFITDQSSATAAADLAKEAIANFDKAVSEQEAKGVTQRGGKGSQLQTVKTETQKETQAAAGVAKSSLDSLTIAFESGNISADIYNQSLSDLFNTLNSAEQPSWMLDSLAEKMGLQDVVKGLTDAADKSLALQAAVAGIDASDDLDILKEASKEENKDNKTIQDNAVKARKRIAAAIVTQTKAQQAANEAKQLSNTLEQDSIEAESIQASIDAYHTLVAAGMDAELAYQLTGDAAQVAALKAAMATDAINGNTAAVDAFKLSAEGLDALKKEREGLKPGGGGGGGQKSAFQQAMDQLKEQQKEAKSSIMAYAKLRSAGFAVGEATTIAKDSMLAAALASEKVGSKKWNELVTAIRAARAEEEAWLNSTPEGRAEHFADVYSKVMDVFNAQENIINMNNEAATATTRKMIEALEKQIDVYQRRSAELERDLEKISEKEDEINKAYDEKNKSLEKVKKINQDIINQQKSQLSIADALSQGDIGAAAKAIQDSRAQNAAAQGDAIGNALDASRQAELKALTQNGKTRAEIEDEIKRIKKEIETIEFGALQNARDAVELADELAAAAIENLRVQGLSKTEWENINTRIDASKANAALYEAEVAKALINAQGLVGEWSKLNDTYTTTHVVNTIHTSSGGGSGGNGSTTTTTNDPNADNPTTQANRIRQAMNDRAISAKVSAELRKAAGVSNSTGDRAEALINSYLAKITKAQADAILRAAGALSTGGGGGGGRMLMAAKGGMISPSLFASGGFAKGTDTVPSMLTPGEFVVNKASTKRFAPLLQAINSGNFKYSTPSGLTVPNDFSKPVYNMPEKAYAPAGGTMPLNSQLNTASSLTSQDNSVYNYSLSVNVDGTNASPDQIANVVMKKLQGIDSQRVRRQVIR